MRSVCLMTCYMGPLPNYFGYFAATCKSNSSVDFIVINDHISESYTDGNIRYIKMDLEKLNLYSSQKLHETIKLKNSWKINELKPLFGHLFAEDFNRYDHWGWCDLDIIWGDLRHFLTDQLLEEYDVITTREHWSTGHFTLFKNNELCNSLYKRNTGIIELLNNPTYFAFEECCHRWNGERFSFEMLREKNLLVSMYDIIRDAEGNHELKAHFKHIIREYPQPINYEYKNSKLVDLNNQEEFMYYHLLIVKKIWRYFIPSYKPGCDALVINHRGIRCTNSNRFLWEIKRLQNAAKGIRKSAKDQSFASHFKKLFKFKRTWV